MLVKEKCKFGRRKFVEFYDSDEVPDFNPSEINQDPATIYTAASQVLAKLTFTQKRVTAAHSKVSELIR